MVLRRTLDLSLRVALSKQKQEQRRVEQVGRRLRPRAPLGVAPRAFHVGLEVKHLTSPRVAPDTAHRLPCDDRRPNINLELLHAVRLHGPVDDHRAVVERDQIALALAPDQPCLPTILPLPMATRTSSHLPRRSMPQCLRPFVQDADAPRGAPNTLPAA